MYREDRRVTEVGSSMEVGGYNLVRVIVRFSEIINGEFFSGRVWGN